MKGINLCVAIVMLLLSILFMFISVSFFIRKDFEGAVVSFFTSSSFLFFTYIVKRKL